MKFRVTEYNDGTRTIVRAREFETLNEARFCCLLWRKSARVKSWVGVYQI